MKNIIHTKSVIFSVLTVLLALVASHSASAASGDGFSRGKGVLVRVGAGAPINLNLGAGYRFGPHFALAAEAYSYSGLTALTGAIDARYHILDNSFTPFAAAKLGYGSLGEDYDYKNVNDFIGSLTAGVSWRGFDLGAGIIYDPFHKLGFTANLSWTYCFKIK